MAERCSETKYYPQDVPLDGKLPIPKFTSFEASNKSDSPQPVQASKAARVDLDTASPTKIDQKEPTPPRKTTKPGPSHFHIAAGDSSDEDPKQISLEVGPPSSSNDAPRDRPLKVPKQHTMADVPPTIYYPTDPQESSNGD